MVNHKKMETTGLTKIQKGRLAFESEDELSEHLLKLASDAQSHDLDAEAVLRKTLTHLEYEFHCFERQNKPKQNFCLVVSSQSELSKPIDVRQ